MQQQLFDFGQSTPAAERERRNLVIEAGAGTGKTTAIVGEVLRLMAENETLAPERIVLMTFTEKAAGEIADRIREALETLTTSSSLQWPPDSANPLLTIQEEQRARLARHLTNLDALKSQTIHSFCQTLLRGFPIEAGLDPQFKIIEGFERSLLYGQLYDAWIDRETRVQAEPPVVEEWELLFTHVNYLFFIRDLVLGFIDRRDLLHEIGYDFGSFDEVREDLRETLNVLRRTKDEGGDEHARRIAAYVREHEPMFSTIEEALAYLQPIAASMREANLPRKGGVLKDVVVYLRCGDKGKSIYDRLVSHRAAMAVLAMTRRFVEFLDEEKRKLGVVDFDDLLLRTLALLDDPVVLTRARGLFDVIFVDEFQDTDRTQARIIERLARDEDGQFVPGRTIVVGDPKQSIYGFRRADPETYRRMTESLRLAGAERRILEEQYRSDPPVVDGINAIFARLFPQQLDDPNVFRPAYHPLRAARTKNRRELDARFTVLRAEPDPADARFFAEGEAIARWIQRNRDGSPLDLQRFAILFRRMTRLDAYIEVLERHGIDFVLPPTRLFLDRRAPVELLSVLRAIAWPFDRGAQVSAARSTYFALTDDEIVAGMQPQAMPDGDAEAWSQFQDVCAELRGAAPQLTVAELIDLVIRTTRIEPAYAAMADGERHLRHLDHMRSIAFDYVQSTGGSVRQFVDEIGRRRAEPEETEPSLIDESQNAVRIMTVHASKGLEFETVILPDLSFNSSSSDPLQLFTVEEPRSIVLAGRAESISGTFRKIDGEPLKKIGGQREEAEMRRLFYVAVTRAKTDVVFACDLQPDTKTMGFLKCLTEVLETDIKTLPSLWPQEGRLVRETPVGPVAFEVAANANVDERARQRLADTSLEADLRAQDVVPLELAHPDLSLTRMSTAEAAARRAASRGRAGGTLLHRVLETWDGRSSVEPALDRAVAEFGAEPEVVARVRRRLSTIPQSPTFRRILAAETIGREFPIRFCDESGRVTERRIDRLLREQDRELVVDYKSGSPQDERVRKDREQVARYCAAIQATTGRPCSGLVWYVEEDVAVEVTVPPPGADVSPSAT
jgi:ATP-dependent helicase/nuclease subunit A